MQCSAKYKDTYHCGLISQLGHNDAIQGPGQRIDVVTAIANPASEPSSIQMGFRDASMAPWQQYVQSTRTMSKQARLESCAVSQAYAQLAGRCKTCLLKNLAAAMRWGLTTTSTSLPSD